MQRSHSQKHVDAVCPRGVCPLYRWPRRHSPAPTITTSRSTPRRHAPSAVPIFHRPRTSVPRQNKRIPLGTASSHPVLFVQNRHVAMPFVELVIPSSVNNGERNGKSERKGGEQNKLVLSVELPTHRRTTLPHHSSPDGPETREGKDRVREKVKR